MQWHSSGGACGKPYGASSVERGWSVTLQAKSDTPKGKTKLSLKFNLVEGEGFEPSNS